MSTEFFSPDAVDADADGLRLEYALQESDDNTPADVMGHALRALHAWDREQADPTLNTPAGGEQYLMSIAPPHLDVDVEPDESDPSVVEYLVAIPDRELTDREVKALDAAGGDAVRAAPGYIILMGQIGTYITDPNGTFRINNLTNASPAPRLSTSDELSRRAFWPTREIGTLPVDTSATRDAVAKRAADLSPHSSEEDTGVDGAGVATEGA